MEILLKTLPGDSGWVFIQRDKSINTDEFKHYVETYVFDNLSDVPVHLFESYEPDTNLIAVLKDINKLPNKQI